MTMTPDEITRAARTLVDHDPPADLEARIRQRLDTTGPAAPPRRWPHIVLAATSLASVALVLLITREPHLPIAPSPHLPISPFPHLLISPSPHLPISSSPHLPISPSLTVAELAWMARRIPALDPIEALTVDQMVFDSIQPEPLSITPLTMTPLTVSPVTGDADAGRSR